MSTQVHLVGRLTADPELRFAPSGVPIAKFTVVTSRRVRDKQSGEWSDADTSFWDCTAFNQTAENVAESLQRGYGVIVHGRMAQRSYETREGEKRKAFEVTVDDVGPSLRNATAKVAKAQRSSGGFGQDAPPGGGRQGGQRDTYGGQRGATPPDDPWATSSSGGSQSGNSDDPPF